MSSAATFMLEAVMAVRSVPAGTVVGLLEAWERVSPQLLCSWRADMIVASAVLEGQLRWKEVFLIVLLVFQ